MFLIHPSPVLYDIEVKKLTILRRPKDLCQDAVDFDCDTPDSKGMRADKLWHTMPGLWEQEMLRHRDAEMIEIAYLNQGVDLRGFPRLRKFVGGESVVPCNAINIYEGTAVMLNDHPLYDDHSDRDVAPIVLCMKYRLFLSL